MICTLLYVHIIIYNVKQFAWYVWRRHTSSKLEKSEMSVEQCIVKCEILSVYTSLQ